MPWRWRALPSTGKPAEQYDVHDLLIGGGVAADSRLCALARSGVT
ncbi:hypothetical protein [Nonomuraea lactucae]|nr:hypothetical protein [Nonomuraea lactucae]